jgi:hypothetical protein
VLGAIFILQNQPTTLHSQIQGSSYCPRAPRFLDSRNPNFKKTNVTPPKSLLRDSTEVASNQHCHSHPQEKQVADKNRNGTLI